jgi:hypothetical protein
MKSDSVCWTCTHCVSYTVTEDYWAGRQYDEDCEEGSEQFMAPEGCYCYEERKEYEDDL